MQFLLNVMDGHSDVGKPSYNKYIYTFSREDQGIAPAEASINEPKHEIFVKSTVPPCCENGHTL